jgi:hypothetical protein
MWGFYVRIWLIVGSDVFIHDRKSTYYNECYNLVCCLPNGVDFTTILCCDSFYVVAKWNLESRKAADELGAVVTDNIKCYKIFTGAALGPFSLSKMASIRVKSSNFTFARSCSGDTLCELEFQICLDVEIEPLMSPDTLVSLAWRVGWMFLSTWSRCFGVKIMRELPFLITGKPPNVVALIFRVIENWAWSWFCIIIANLGCLYILLLVISFSLIFYSTRVAGSPLKRLWIK